MDSSLGCAVLGFCFSICHIEKYRDITIYHGDCSIRVTDCSVRVFRSFVIKDVTYSSATLLNAVNVATINAKKCYQKPYILVKIVIISISRYNRCIEI